MSVKNECDEPEDVFRKRAAEFLAKGIHSDMTFIVGLEDDSAETFKAHKLLLAIGSEVFEAMFYGELSEKGVVRVTDLHPDGFRGILGYIYKGSLQASTILEALYTRHAAQKYMIRYLLKLCNEYINENLDTGNVCQVMDHEIGGSDFEESITSILERNIEKVLESSAFIVATEATVHRILRTSNLSVSESDLVCSLYAWARAKCSREADSPTELQDRPVRVIQESDIFTPYLPGKTETEKQIRCALDPFLREIRLLDLTPDEFIDGPLAWNVFSDEEALSILANLIRKGSMQLPSFCRSVDKL